MAQFTQRDYDTRLSLHYQAWTWALDAALHTILVQEAYRAAMPQLMASLAEVMGSFYHMMTALGSAQSAMSEFGDAMAGGDVVDDTQELLN